MKFRLFPAKKDDKWIFYAVIGLSIFSILMVASASVGYTSQQSDAVIYNMGRQIIYFILGYFLMMFFFHYFNLKKIRPFLPLITLIMSLLLLATLFFPAVNGAKAWIPLPYFSVQPSEFVKVFVIVFIATYFPRFYYRKMNPADVVRYPLFIFLFWLFVVGVLQSDIGTAGVILLIVMTIALMLQGSVFREVKGWTRILFIVVFVGLIFVVTPLGIAFIRILPVPEYMKQRFYMTVDPFEDQFGYGYAIFHSLVALARGGLLGVGYGNSVKKFGYIPESRTDFIFPIIIEELGIIGLLVILVGYGIIFYKLFASAIKIKDEGSKIILIGTIAYLFIHFVLNIGGVSALIPLTGVPLLLISSGGSSTLCIMSLLGICMNIINNPPGVNDEGD